MPRSIASRRRVPGSSTRARVARPWKTPGVPPGWDRARSCGMILAACFLLFAAGCQRPAVVPARADAKAEAPAAPSALATVRPERQTVRHTIEQPGRVEAFEETPLYARLSGYVKQVRVDIGDAVKEGDVLAELAVPEMDVELTQKEALVKQADAELKLARDSVAVAEAEHRRGKSQYER